MQFLRSAPVDDGFRAKPVFALHGDPVRGRRFHVSDGERWRASEVSAHVTARFHVRRSAFTDGITPKDRFQSDGLTYDITGIKPVLNSLIWLEITAAARADG